MLLELKWNTICKLHDVTPQHAYQALTVCLVTASLVYCWLSVEQELEHKVLNTGLDKFIVCPEKSV